MFWQRMQQLKVGQLMHMARGPWICAWQMSHLMGAPSMIWCVTRAISGGGTSSKGLMERFSPMSAK